MTAADSTARRPPTLRRSTWGRGPSGSAPAWQRAGSGWTRLAGLIARTMPERTQAYVLFDPSTRGTERLLATVLFVDIAGSTEHLIAIGDLAWRRTLDQFNALARREVAHHRGREI